MRAARPRWPRSPTTPSWGRSSAATGGLATSLGCPCPTAQSRGPPPTTSRSSPSKCRITLQCLPSMRSTWPRALPAAATSGPSPSSWACRSASTTWARAASCSCGTTRNTQ
uniref:Putative secreted protein n=1 Tax=Ixodes ricinus TaxID=34613 RepID=A0A6B0UJA5_IXORI